MRFIKSFPALITFLLIFTGTIKDVQASHSEGADLSYVCLGGDSFLITLSFYRDCRGIAAPASAAVDIDASSPCTNSLNLTLQKDTSYEVSPLCATQINNSACHGGSLPGVEVHIYSAIIHLPAQCTDWVISYNLCCRNDQITTLTTPGSDDIYIEAHLNNANGLCNNSPTFTSLPVPYVCANQPFNYNHGAIDVDGDSLVFSSVCPLISPNTCAVYNSPYGPNNPMNLTGPFVFNTQTGQMTFTPNGIQVGVVAVLVKEYRNGVLIGSTMRDIQVIVIACTNDQPVETSIQNPSGGNQTSGNVIEVCPGSDLSFQFTATDPNASNVLTMTTNVASSIPGAAVTITPGTGNSLIGTFNWTPTPLDSGINVLTVTVKDDACPISGITISSYLIYVLDGTYAGPDLYYCPAGGPVQINALGGSRFTWTPSTGLSSDTVRNPLASPAVTTTYIVVSDLDSLCKNKDTVTVNVVPNFTYTLSPDDTICRHSSIPLNIVPDPAYAPFTYTWSPEKDPSGNIILSGTSVPDPIASPLVTTTYNIEVVSDTGCRIRDSVEISVLGVGPIVEISTDKNNVCPGDTVQLNAEIFSLECGPTLQGCSSAPSPIVFGDNSAANFSGTPFQGQSEDGRFQALYLASDMLAQGFTPGTITRIGFEIGSKASSGVYQGFTIKLGCTSASSLSIADGWESTSTIVYGPVSYATSLGLNNFGLSTPFDWDGRTNLIVEICYNNSALSSAGGNDQLLSMATAYNATLRAYDNGTDGCGLNPSFVYTQIPRTTFYMCPASVTNYTLSWTPTSGLLSTNVLNPKAIVTGLQTYSLFVTDSLCDGSGYITLYTDTSYDVDIIPTDPAICGSADSIQLNVQLTGTPPSSVLPCGANPTFTSCSTSSNVRQVGAGVIGTGTGTPYEGFWEDGRVQYLYRASELAAAGMSNSGTISEVQFYVTTKGSTQPYNSFTIKIGCTSANTLSATSFSTASLTTVYGPRSYSSISGWNNHVLDVPYNWDGSSNLIVEVCFNNAGYSDDDDVAYASSGFNSVVYAYTDGSVGCNLTSISGSGSNRANTRFTFCDAPVGTTSIQWTPFSITDPSLQSPVVFPPVTTTYKVDYTFINGCVKSDSVTVVVNDFITDAGPDTIICSGSSVQLNASGGAFYAWDTLPGLSCYNCPNPVVTPTSTTTYAVSISDSTGSCVNREFVTVTVYEPYIKFSNDTLLCFLDSFRLDAGAGFASYQWSPGGQTTQSILVNTPDVYSVTVMDTNGCTASDSIALTVGNTPVIDLGPDVTVCAGDSVTLNAGSGYSNYTWSTLATDSVITVFITDQYSLTVTDSIGCPSNDTVLVQFNSPPMGSLGNDTTLCPGATLTLTAGPPTYTYAWNGGITTGPVYVVTTGGTYSVTITDNTNCSVSDTITVTYTSGNPVDLGGPNAFICNGGSILLDAGTGYTSYSWSTTGTTPVISVSTEGEYSVTVVDQHSCVSSDTVDVVVGNPTVDLGPDVDICAGQSATLDVGPGFSYYQWSPGGQSTRSISVTSSGTYSVTAGDLNECEATDTVMVMVHPLPNPDLGPDTSVCSGYSLSPGTFTFYQWSDSSSNPALPVSDPGTYSVTVTDLNGCSNSDSVNVDVFQLELSLDDYFRCAEDSATTIAAPNGYVTYVWSNGDSTQSITATEEGYYTVTVTDQSGCTATDSSFLDVEQLMVVATANPDTIQEGDVSQLDVTVSNGSGTYNFTWMPDDGTLSNPLIRDPQANPTQNAAYIIYVEDAQFGCTGTDTVFIQVQNVRGIPTAFTPNGDGEDDVFEVIKTGLIAVKEFKVYNRWGQIVHDNVEGWDGTYKGKDQPTGTYVYSIVLELSDGTTEKLSGLFTLIR